MKCLLVVTNPLAVYTILIRYIFKFSGDVVCLPSLLDFVTICNDITVGTKNLELQQFFRYDASTFLVLASEV